MTEIIILILTDEACDRVTPLACMHGVVASLALAVAAHCEKQPRPGVQRQQKALRELAASLAFAFPHRDDQKVMEKVVPLMSALMRNADRCERRGIAHTNLLPSPAPLPSRRLRIDPATLCLVAVMRLRVALEKICVRVGEPKRVRQLRLAVELEGALSDMCRAFGRRSARSRQTAIRADKLFFELEEAIGDELAAIFRKATRIEDPGVAQLQ